MLAVIVRVSMMRVVTLLGIEVMLQSRVLTMMKSTHPLKQMRN